MIQSIINTFMLIFSFIFSQMNHPLAMGFMLLMQTFIICLISGLMNENFWFSYILFLVFLGGMLVLFIYVTSLASNEMFNFSMKLSILSFMIMLFLMFIMILLNYFEFSFNNNNEMLNSFFNENMKETFKSINKLYNFPTNLISLLLMNYLFFTLIVAVKITNFFYGPLRNLN